VQLYRDDGIVLRTQKLGEADRIITILGRTSGRVRAVAKGVRRTKSRFGARLEPFTHVDLMLETAERFTPVEKEPALRQLLLLIGGLRALGDAEHAPGLVLDAFLLRSLAVAGYAPALQECARCGAPESGAPESGALRSGRRLPAFAVAAGGMVCSSC